MTLPEVLGVVVATAVTIVLRWAAHRWPLPERKKPSSRKRPRARDDEDDDDFDADTAYDDAF